MPEEKLQRLRDLIRSYESCVVAYSGGVDSAFLATITHQVLGAKALAVIADSPSLPRKELDEAVSLASARGILFRVIKTDEFSNPNYTANPQNRCYFCKQELFVHLERLVREEGFNVIAYGENASDIGASRPGSKAAAEFRVCAPLKEVGLTKSEIRQLSTQMGLPTADKPQMACLSSRIPHGEIVTPEKLLMVEHAEAVLRNAGFYDVRVRHHELKNGQAMARIEVGPSELGRLAGSVPGIVKEIKPLGYAFVTVDLEGYHRVEAPVQQSMGAVG